MPKLKTNKAAKKRFRITKTGKIMFTKTKKRHLLADRTPKKKRQIRGWKSLHPTHQDTIIRYFPYDR
jgi:large subunit ribosomal protein L35